MSQLAIGAKAPDFKLQDANGRTHQLSQALAAGPVALVFFKSDCPTCQFSFPFVQRIFANAGKPSGLTLWGISQEDAEETRRFARQYGASFDILIDEYPYDVSSVYGLEFVPGIFLIQQDGTIKVSEYGFTKAGLNQVAGFEFFTPDDGIPARRPG